MAARSLWVILCRIRTRPGPASSPSWRANWSRARAHARAHRRKLDAAGSSVGLAQAGGQRRHDIDVELGTLAQHLGEGGAADEGELAVPAMPGRWPTSAGRRSSPARPRSRPAQDSENALLAVSRKRRTNRKHAAAQPVAAVAGVAALEQRFAFAQPERPLAGEQLPRERGRKRGQQVRANSLRCDFRRCQNCSPLPCILKKAAEPVTNRLE